MFGSLSILIFKGGVISECIFNFFPSSTKWTKSPSLNIFLNKLMSWRKVILLSFFEESTKLKTLCEIYPLSRVSQFSTRPTRCLKISNLPYWTATWKYVPNFFEIVLTFVKGIISLTISRFPTLMASANGVWGFPKFTVYMLGQEVLC